MSEVSSLLMELNCFFRFQTITAKTMLPTAIIALEKHQKNQKKKLKKKDFTKKKKAKI